VIAYTGDTEWTDNLIELGRDADLPIAESYYYDRLIPFHLSYRTLLERLPTIAPKRLVLTHMSDDMLRRSVDINHERASTA
jgi:ribonuclease BN (tRNA processing enzyme)